MTLPLVISPGDVGHIGDHEEIDLLLERLQGQADFIATGVLQDLLANMPAAGAANLGMLRYASDVPELAYSDGSTWHQTVLASTPNEFTAIQNFDEDVFFGSGRPWVDVRSNKLAHPAAGDGVAWDTQSVLDAINHIASDGVVVNGITVFRCGIVYFPKGQYRVAPDTLAISHYIGLSFWGAGSAFVANYFHPVTALIVDGAGTYGLSLDGAALETVRNFHMQDVAVQYQGGFAGTLVRGTTNGVRGFTALRCSFGSSSTAGTRPTTCANLIWFEGGHHYRFELCTFSDADYGVRIDNTGGAQTNSWYFAGCCFFDFATVGLACIGQEIKALTLIGCDFDPVTSGTVTQYGAIIAAIGFYIAGCNFGGSDATHSASVHWVRIDSGTGEICGNAFVSSLPSACLRLDGGNTEVTANRFVCRKAILCTSGASITGRSNHYGHSTADAGDVAVDMNLSSQAFYELGPDRFSTETAPAIPFDSSYKLPGSPPGGLVTYYRPFDLSTNGITAYLAGGGATIRGLDVRGRDLNGAVTLTTKDTGAILTPSATSTYALPSGIGGLEFTFVKASGAVGITINRAGGDLIFDGASTKTTIANTGTDVAAVLTLRSFIPAAGGTWWRVVSKSGSWA